MDPIGRLNRLMETLRKQMAESAKRADAAGHQASDVRPQTRSERPSIQELRSRIVERVRGIQSESGENRRRARRVFVESVVAWEFGDQLLLDNRFEDLVDQIEETFEMDTELDKKFHDLITDLTHG